MSDPPVPPAFPPALMEFSRADVVSQRVPLRLERWREEVLVNRPDLATALDRELLAHRGIRRSFVHDLAGGDAVDLFIAAMAWGYGPDPRGPSKVQKMMSEPDCAEKVRDIVEATRTGGAGAGWHALFNEARIGGLGMSFGTKLLYFAGYTSACAQPLPLILDDRVRGALLELGDIVPRHPKQVLQRHYLAYLDAATTWAGDPRWNETPEVVEFALFAMSGRRRS